MNPTDIVQVALTPAGLTHVNGQPISVHGALTSVTFTGADPVPVQFSIWQQLLAKAQVDGAPMYQIVTDLVPAAKPVPVSKSKAAVSTESDTATASA